MPAKHATDTVEIESLLRGDLPPADAERLATELSDDGRVAEVAERLADDTLMSDVRMADTSTDTATEQLAERLVERLKPPAASVTTTALPSTDGPVLLDDEDEPVPAALEYFRIDRVLGQGGMGTVYLADDTRLGRKVAVKTLKASVARKSGAKERFLREARLAAALEHECVVPIYYVGEADGIPFLAMPLLKGQALDEYLAARGGKLPVAEAVRVAAQVATGLAAAHAAGLIHRDIKPSNIWVDDGTGRVRILDFGLARSAGDSVQLTASGMIVGTPAYMPPEQARGRGVDHRADLFSLGVVLYQMLVGRRPFVGNDTVAILSSLALDTPTPPRELNPDVPPAVSALVMKLLEKDAANRPQSAAEVVAVLAPPTAPRPWREAERTEIDATPSAEARSATPRTRTALTRPEPARKIPLVGWVALGLLLLAGGAAAVYQFAFATKDGTLIVEVDADADVRFKNGKLEVYDESGKKLYTLEPSEKNKTLPPGKYRVKVVGADGVKLDTETFELERKGKAWVKVTAAPPKDVAVVEPKKPDPKQPDPKQPGVPGGGLHLFVGDIGAEAPAPALDPQKSWTAEAYLTPMTEHFGNANCRVIGCDQGFGIGVRDGKYFVYSTHGETQGGAVKAGERVHIACVQTETKRMLFLNGKLAASTDNPLAEVKLIVGKLQFSLVNHVPNAPPIDVLVDGVRISQAVRYTKDFAPPGRHVPDKETLALYHCDEGTGDTLTDSSGNKLHAKITNAKWGKPTGATVPPPSAAGGGLRFADATDTSGVTVPTLSIPDKGPFTMEGYVTLRADQGYVAHRVLFGREYQFAVFADTGETATFALWSGGDGKYVHATADKLPNPTKRFHVACVRTDTEHLLFVDGKQVAKSKAMATGAKGFDIGRKVVADFAEIRVSSVARYKDDFVPAPRFTPDKDTVALWHCDDGTGDTLTDSSGNKHHGKIVGGTWVKAVAPPGPTDADRKVAAWVFSKGGTVQVRGDGRNFEAAAELPNGPVTVTAINLFGKKVADDELANLVGLAGLEMLNLNGTRVTDKALVHLKGLKGLKSLDLVSTHVTGDGLAHLAGLENLMELALFNRPITDDSLAHLTGLKALANLQLEGTQVSDKGLAHLKGLKNLRLLHVGSTKVTAAGLPHLTELKALAHLTLRGLPLTAKDVEPLRKALPQCKIEYDGGVIEPK